jgi:hypothetical protein
VDILRWRVGYQRDRWAFADVPWWTHRDVLLSYFLLCFVHTGVFSLLVMTVVFTFHDRKLIDIYLSGTVQHIKLSKMIAAPTS